MAAGQRLCVPLGESGLDQNGIISFGGYMNVEELKSIATSDLVNELKRRFEETAEAQAALNMGTKPMAQISFQRQHKNKNKMRNAAVQRWEGWEKYKTQHG